MKKKTEHCIDLPPDVILSLLAGDQQQLRIVLPKQPHKAAEPGVWTVFAGKKWGSLTYHANKLMIRAYQLEPKKTPVSEELQVLPLEQWLPTICPYRPGHKLLIREQWQYGQNCILFRAGASVASELAGPWLSARTLRKDRCRLVCTVESVTAATLADVDWILATSEGISLRKVQGEVRYGRSHWADSNCHQRPTKAFAADWQHHPATRHVKPDQIHALWTWGLRVTTEIRKVR